jgi:LmbE family N-acetylglucosaminyl deacetylase
MHSTADVAQTRIAELRESCKYLGVTELETLGYHDSGMPDWEFRHSPEAFCNVPLDVVAGRISSLIERYRPDVVVTYDPGDAYQHPDHVHASRAAVAAVELAPVPAKLYLTAMSSSQLYSALQAMRDAGEDVPEVSEEDARLIRDAEERITTTVDIASVLDRKRASLLAHASQIADSWVNKIPPETLDAVFGAEHFIRFLNKTSASVPESDLFAGLR